MIAKNNFSKSLTKGKDYEILEERESEFVVLDDEGFRVGFSKAYFDQLPTMEPNLLVPTIIQSHV